jgi:hypothetical protein
VRWLPVFCVCAVICGGTWLVISVFVRDRSVSRALADQVQRGPGAIVDFTEITPFAWDRVYVFEPYTGPKDIEASLGFRWEGVKDTTIEWSESVNLVVFVFDGRVVHWFEQPRNRGELLGLANSGGYTRNEARFAVCLVGRDGRLGLTKPRR